MDRVLVYDRLDNPVTELAPGDVFGRVRTEEINGIHSLEITTTRVLAKNQRVLTCDAMGKWREYVVEGVDALHEAGERPIGTYYCEWSMQHDLTLTRVSRMPGVQNPVPASQACEAALSGTNRWSVGTVTCLTSAGSSMYDMSGWEAMSVLVQVWGCEVEPEIGVDESGVVSRRVAVLSHVGSETAMRRFDYGSDLVSIVRSVSEEPVYARISPRGAGEEVDDGYGRRITIESVNGGVDWLQNDETADLLKVPDGAGGWEYPVGIVENPGIDDPQKLKDWGLSVLEDYTTPKVTYKAAVLQYQKAGMDIKGISLGDNVQCVDRMFYEDGLRISGRVVALVVNELDETDAQVTIGNAQESAASALAQMAATLGMTEAAVRAMNGGTLSTAAYLSRLLDRINSEINATGGYTYITEGQGIRTYDKAVSDPSIGVEADAVVEIKGGTVRIANSRTAQGAWEWKTVFTSGHIAGELVTAAQIVTGYIGSSGGTFIDLDNNTVQLGMLSRRHVIINDGGLDIKSGSDLMGHFGYGYGTNSSDGISLAPYYDMGIRKSGSTVGNYSIAGGYESTASGFCSRASGQSTTASGIYSFASGMNTKASGQCGIAEGSFTTASGSESHACGSNTTASGGNSFTVGDHTEAAYMNQFACGYYNSNANGNLFEVGNGYEGHRSNAFRVNSSGTAYVGSTQVTSDRRVKKPLGGITEAEAVEFVRSLKPSKFEKFGRKELGFYAQDVEDTNLGEYLVDESDDHGYEDFKNLSYDGLIAPLVAYCQHLEKRIEQLEARLDETGGAE